MSFTLMHRDGEDEDGVHDRIPALLAELDGPRDDEHPDVAITDDGGWCLSAFQSGRLVWENIEDDGVAPRHLPPVSRTEAVRVMTLVADGRLDLVEALDWRPGYNP